MLLTEDSVKYLLGQITDPEIPVITIEELGILRSVNIQRDKVTVEITPTYSGCPAMNAIEKEIKSVLKKNGIENAEVKLVLFPVWTTDWMSDEAKEKLRAYGISPPGKLNRMNSITGDRKAECPRCGSKNVTLVSLFGSTACKAIYKCNDCLEPFDQFKCH